MDIRTGEDQLDAATRIVRRRLRSEFSSLSTWERRPPEPAQQRMVKLLTERVEDLEWMLGQLLGAKQIAEAVTSTTSRDQDTREDDILRRRKETG